MTRNSEFGLTGVDTAATGGTLKGGLARTLGANSIKAMFAGDGRNQALGRASIISLVVFVVGAAFTCAAQIVTARIIGPDSYGVYAYVLAWVTLLGYSSTLGFHVSLLRFVPAYQAKEEWALARGVIRYSRRVTAGTAASIVLVGVCGIAALHGSLRPELALSLLLGVATAAGAHGLAPALLEIAELAPDRVAISFKTSVFQAPGVLVLHSTRWTSVT